MKWLIWNFLVFLFLPVFFFAALFSGKRKKYYVWGSTPLLANRYWSEALKEIGLPSLTIMEAHFSINRRADFDYYFDDFAPSFLPLVIRRGIGSCLALVYVLQRAAVLHTAFDGFALNRSYFWRLESFFLRLANVKMVTIVYGGDNYRYSTVIDTSLRHGLLTSYPAAARNESRIAKRVQHWNKRSHAVLTALMVDGAARWDVPLIQFYSIDTRGWKPKSDYSGYSGSDGVVKILHTPNHRGFKGTEFLVAAVDELKKEGLQVELVLLEKVPNEKVREIMQSVDILAEQFIATGYAMSGIEGMATGLPVMANLEQEAYTRIFRRYSFLNECPVLSTTPETIKQNLRLLIENPALRRELGIAGRAYVEKYHSYTSAQHLFTSIYDKVVHGKPVDLMNLYHPLKDGYSRRSPFIQHPLIENKLPATYPVR